MPGKAISESAWRRCSNWQAAALFALGFVFLFRAWLFSGFDRAFGDDEDGYLALALIEHWRHVFSGAARWADPFFFYPQRGALGYTDAFFLFGLAHAPLRLLGADTFTAYMLVMAGLAAVGFFGFRRLAVRHFGIRPAYAAIGAFLFAFANMDAVKLIHAQAYAAMLLPSLCDLMLSAWAGRRQGWSMVLAAAAGLLYAALFLTGFQTAWFFGLLVLLVVLLHPIIYGPAESRAVAAEMLTTRRPMTIAAACGFAVGIVPFLILYVPVLTSGNFRDFAEVAGNMPQWRDLANVTPGNAVWGGALQWLGIVGRPDRPVWEVELALTPAVTAIFLAGLSAWTIGSRRRAQSHAVFVLLGIAVLVLWLLQMEYFGARPWRAIWTAVPGAKAIRYTFRSQLVANLFVALIVAKVLGTMLRQRAWTVLLCAFLVAEQLNLNWPATMSRQAALSWIDAAPPPPAGCRVFYALPSDAAPHRSGWKLQDDAVLFAEIRGIPTVNGYSSWFPEGWMLHDPASAGYAAAVTAWAARHGISRGLCGLDLHAGRWTAGDARP
ncbi:MAG: hypothetical protein IT538_15290 [Variibacter sp.]|nr:hypothetical protein [Variibacter sp.]